MRCLIRADASEAIGTGHVMRCLTIAEELTARGHEVVLRGSVENVAWLEARIIEAGVTVESVPPGTMSTRAADYEGIEMMIIDSYTIPADAITAANRIVPVMLVIDGDGRGADATRYLDQNLGADGGSLSPTQRRRLLAGPRYALVRKEIVALRRPDVREISGRPRICAFMGGSDPTGAMVTVAGALEALSVPADIDLVVTDRWRDAVTARAGRLEGVRVHPPTPRLPHLLAAADVAVSATGTSAWDVCTLGVPAVFAAVVDNQRAGFAALMHEGLALGVDLSTSTDAEADLTAAVERLLDDAPLRRRLFAACADLFDGRGAARVADQVEALAAGLRAGG
ncbi:PseG/SpsG family protein [Microbacterium sp. UBA6633]|uniref:PseG/SpsG family protein n=1 Tax=Microbacterium sp. UBA6633 TaxID=1946951 RepID=UPI0025DED0AE|nr:hypothetical protein [Microbacterium sp. UBA6633]